MIKALLNSTHIQKRLKWCNDVMNLDWNDVIFTDETILKCTRYKRRYWGYCGARKIKHPPKIYIWGCFLAHGFGTLYLFTKNLNSNLMVESYKRVLMRSVRKSGFANNSDWYLQEDNDTKHMANLSKKWKSRKHVKIIDWPQ